VIVGQITSWKGHDTAIRALHELRRDHPRARLLIVGEVKFADASTRLDNRGYLEGLRRLVEELDLGEAVAFAGERADISKIMARADVVLVPSVEEPFGRSVAEAMAVGTPVLATTVGGPAELIEDGVSGLLAPPGEPAAWSEAIERILDDPEWALQMGRRASDLAQRRFAVGAHVAAMMEVYQAASRPAERCP
jgi:glycosyltransferase involved in cell wall biosynthesis